MEKIFVLVKRNIFHYYALMIYVSIILLTGLGISAVLMSQENHRNNLDTKLIETSHVIDGQFFSKVKDTAFSIASNSSIVKICRDKGPLDSPKAMVVQDVIKNAINASIVYVLDVDGNVISCTKIIGIKTTLTGENYKFRPYFTKAMEGNSQIYGAIGVTTLERGVYFSAPVIDPDTKTIIGVAVVKMSLSIIDEILNGIDDYAAIVTPEGIIFSTNQKEWLFKSIFSIDEETQKKLYLAKQFAGLKIEHLESRYDFKKDTEYINDKKYYVAVYPFYLYNWKIIICQKPQKGIALNLLQRIILLSLFATITTLIIVFFMIYLNQKTNKTLKEYESNYLQVFDAVNDSIFIHDVEDGRVIDVNKKMCEMFGYNKKELLNGTTDLISAADEGYNLANAKEHMKKAINGAPDIFDWKAKDKKGRTFWVEVNLKKSIISGKAVILAVVRDINERKINEEKIINIMEELKRSNAELQEFAYVASHDLKEPLRTVSSYVQLLQKRYLGKLDKDADDFIGYAVGGAKQMQNFIDDLLTYSRVGTKGINAVQINVNTLVNKLEENLKLVLKEKNGSVKFSKLPDIKGDLMQIEQVFLNVFSNSIKYSKKDIPLLIEISAQKHDNLVTFKVKDNGIGIDKKYFEKVFVIFQKLHSKEEYEGTGIGLSICKKIVERHGGNIWIESDENDGTSVFFTLPCA